MPKVPRGRRPNAKYPRVQVFNIMNLERIILLKTSLGLQKCLTIPIALVSNDSANWSDH